jgi:hypothetical protein
MILMRRADHRGLFIVAAEISTLTVLQHDPYRRRGHSGVPTVQRVDVVGAFETARISRCLQTDTAPHRLN